MANSASTVDLEILMLCNFHTTSTSWNMLLMVLSTLNSVCGLLTQGISTSSNLRTLLSKASSTARKSERP